MSLSIVNNVASLTAQQNLNKTSTRLSESLERLSTGLKINRGADGPAALVISERNRAQIAGLQTAIDNSNKSTALVQTAEGALNEVSSLLTKIRSLAIDSANTGVNDSTALSANQQEITNALASIDRIGTNTQFGNRVLFNGSSAFAGTATSTNVTVLKTTSAASAGANAVTISTAGKQANTTGTVDLSAGTTAAETLTINGSNIVISNAETLANVVAGINAVSAQTGVNAAADSTNKFVVLNTTAYGSAQKIAITESSPNLLGLSTASGQTTINNGVDIQGNIGGGATATGVGNVLTSNGITIQVGPGAAGSFSTSTTGGSVNVVDNSLTFQIGANSGQTVKFGFDKVASASLGLGANSTVSNLGAIDVRSATGAQNALSVIDQAISDISTLRGNLGAFQANTLESNTNTLQAALQNTTAAESTIRDTDFASEIAKFTRSQVQLQAGASVLGNANQIPQLVASLLKG